MVKSPAKTKKSISKQIKPFFSIVIPTLNEESFLPDLLNDLKSQTFNQFEVIVVDGNSIDNTVKKARIYSKSFPLQVIESNISNVATQRNIGTQHSEANWIIFMDSDNRLPLYFLEGIKYNLSKFPKTQVFTCLLDADDNSASAQLVSQALNAYILLQQKTKTYFALGAMIGIHREVVGKISFKAEYSVGEEQEYLREVIQSGFKFTIISDPRYIYSLRRLRKYGLLKTATINAKVFLYSFGKQALIDKPELYVMQGGSYYSEKHLSIWNRYTNRGLSKPQLSRLKAFIDSLKPFSST